MILDNELGHKQSAAMISEIIENNHSIEQFYLSCINFTSNSVKTIQKGLKKNITLRFLDLSKNSLTNAGFIFLMDGIVESNIHTLNLGSNQCFKHFTKSYGKDVIRYLKENKSLTYLDLHNNEIYGGDSKSFQNLCDGLSVNSSLKTIRLNEVFILDTKMKQLTDSLKKNKFLTTLNFGYSFFEKEYEELITNMLQENIYLQAIISGKINERFSYVKI
eukprot:gene9006-1105_t